MLQWITSFYQFRFEEFLTLYGNREKDQRYFQDMFFRTPGAVLAIWEENDRYVSALRLEPYQNGLLIAGLVTALDQRQKGYASQLIQAVQERLESGVKLYSHVDKKNIASLAVHYRCGFREIKECARYLDGSVDFKCCTLLYDEKNPAS